jgi:citrate lyase beta subunit
VSAERGIDALARVLDERLRASDESVARAYPGDPGTRQPVHTVYVPADRYAAGLERAYGDEALALLDERLGTPQSVAAVLGLDPGLAAEVLPLVRAKLADEPIEDLRIDFEDGFGHRADEEEDAAVDAAVAALSAAAGPPFVGLRFKSLEAGTRLRGLRTLDRFVAGLVARGGLPDGFVVTLPKVTAVEQVDAMVTVCEHLESAHGLPAGRLHFEIQVETPQSVLLPDGTVAVARMIAAARGRCSGLHYGTYDYSASCGIAAEYQSMEHPAADHAKAVMQVAAAGTGVRLSDGSTNIVPVGDDAAVRAAWSLHARLVRRSLERGFYQGWDLHPAQLPTRYLATFAFYRRGFPASAGRLRAYLGRQDSGFLDEPATARALAWFISRGVHCGALRADEVAAATGLGPQALDDLAHQRGR